MRKKLTISRLRKKAWTIFSIYIRRKDADYLGIVSCVTCGLRAHWKTLHASHLVPGRKLGILFDERGVFPCCYGCNVCKNGNYREYDAFIDREFGQEYRIKLIEELRQLSKQSTKWARTEYENIINLYTDKLTMLDTKCHNT